MQMTLHSGAMLVITEKLEALAATDFCSILIGGWWPKQ